MKVKWTKSVSPEEKYVSGIGTVINENPKKDYGWYVTTAITHKRIGPFSTANKAKRFLQNIHQLEVEFDKTLQEKAHKINGCGVWN